MLRVRSLDKQTTHPRVRKDSTRDEKLAMEDQRTKLIAIPSMPGIRISAEASRTGQQLLQ